MSARRTTTSSEQQEWDRAARAGRRVKLPLVYGLVCGFVVTIAGFAAIAAFAQDMQDRADEGEIVHERRGPKTTLGVLAAPVVLGALTFAVVFAATGGKLSAEHTRALRR